MSRAVPAWLCLALILLAACRVEPRSTPVVAAVTGHPDIHYLAERRMRGTLVLGFEVSTFDDCWLEMSRDASVEFVRLAPDAVGRGPHLYRVEMIARRTPPDTGARFGHLGAYRCQVQAVRFLALRRDRRRR